ncbi:MAG: type II toxin-antitoxin system RelE/ParE family toxin [Candidatus Peribacteraceae bacterium]
MIPRIEFAIRALSDDPHPLGSLKLHTAEGNYYRIRVGAYRVVFEVAHEIRIVTIFRVGHRKDVYRNL